MEFYSVSSELAEHSLDLLDALEHADRSFDSRVNELLGVLDPTDIEWAREVSDRINVLDGLVERVGLGATQRYPLTRTSSRRPTPTHLGDVVDEDVVKLALMALGSEELDEVVSLALGSDSASDAVARIEERKDGMATTRSVGAAGPGSSGT
jgi:hypothetical protein